MTAINSIQGAAAPLATGQDRAQRPQGRMPEPPDPPLTEQTPMDREAVAELAARLQEAVDRVADQSHTVSFSRDERADGYVIEIRNLDGTLKRQFPPEKVLNLRARMADLSGMVVDETI